MATYEEEQIQTFNNSVYSRNCTIIICTRSFLKSNERCFEFGNTECFESTHPGYE